MSSDAPGVDGTSAAPPVDDEAGRTIGEALRSALGGLSAPAAATVIGVSGAVTYTLLRTASDQFYAPLGLSPEDVGFGYAELLVRALGVLWVPFFLAVILLVPCAMVAALVQIGEAAEKVRSGRLGAAVGVACVLLLVGVLAVPSAAFALLVALMYGFGIVGLWRTPVGPGLVRVVGVVVALLVVLGAALLVLDARSSADQVRDGRGQFGIARFILPWEASVVEVRWLGEPQSQPTAGLKSTPPDKLRCAVYLGAHDDLVVLVNPRDDTTVRLPAGDVTLTTYPPTDDGYPVCEPTGVKWKQFDPPER